MNTAQARALGYDNYLELGYYRMCRNCYGREEVEAFFIFHHEIVEFPCLRGELAVHLPPGLQNLLGRAQGRGIGNPDMTPAERHAAWLELERQYRPHQDYGDDPFRTRG